MRWWDFLAGQCPGVPEENSRYLPRRVPGELVEGVPQLVVMRGVRAEHDDRGVPYRRSARNAARCALVLERFRP